MIQSPPIAMAAFKASRVQAGRAFARVSREFRQWWITRRTRKIVADLTVEQLADAGIDPSSVIGPMFNLVVGWGYHANATGWR